MNDIHDEDEIDIREVFRTVWRHRWGIILITLLVLLASAVYAYYQPSIYKASTTIEIAGTPKKSLRSDDLLQSALMGGSSGEIDTEIEIIKSRFLVLEALQQIHLKDRIWGIDRFHKAHELWEHVPFTITLTRGRALYYMVYPQEKGMFRLEVSGKDPRTGEKVSYRGNHRFGQTIRHRDFELTLQRTEYPMQEPAYRFAVHDMYYYADEIRSKQLKASQVSKKANIVRISYEDTVPKRAQSLVNTLADAYMTQNIHRKTLEAEQTLKFVNKQLAIIEEGLQQSAAKLEQFKQKNKTIDVTLSAEQLSKTLLEYESQQSILAMQIDVLQSMARKIKQGKRLETLTLAGTDLQNPNLSKLIGDLQQAILKQKGLAREYTAAHPEVKKNAAQIRQLRSIIRKSISSILQGLKEKQKLLAKNIAKYQKKLETLPKMQRNYLSLERNFAFNEKFYSYLMEKRTETEIQRAATVSQNRIIDRALLPQQPIKPKRKLIVAVGLILGLILGIFFAFVREFFDNTIKGEEEIAQLTEVPVIGTIPHYIQGKEVRTLMVRERPKSAVAESFRHLRTNLQFMMPEGKGHIIAVTSTVAGEGKTSVASNLAVIQHMLDKKVLIINFDLRKPMLHTLFGVSNSKGLSTYLSGHAAWEETIAATPYEGLDIIPSGPVPPNPSELIASERTAALLEALRSRYDLIILDTPPVGLVTDARTLLTHADAVLYLIRAGYSKKEFLKSVESLHQHENIHGLGIVLNDLKGSKNGYGYGYGSGYGYGYYEES